MIDWNRDGRSLNSVQQCIYIIGESVGAKKV